LLSPNHFLGTQLSFAKTYPVKHSLTNNSRKANYPRFDNSVRCGKLSAKTADLPLNGGAFCLSFLARLVVVLGVAILLGWSLKFHCLSI
jgi:hypothetical protein